MYRRCSINVYRCAEPHKFQAILKDDTDPACPRTLLVAKTAGCKNLTRELLDHRVTEFRWWRKRESCRERKRWAMRQKGRRESAGRRKLSRNCSNNAKWRMIRATKWYWNPLESNIYYYPSTSQARYRSADRLLSPLYKVASASTVARLPGFFTYGISSDFPR